jgi:hypothetical protein
VKCTLLAAVAVAASLAAGCSSGSSGGGAAPATTATDLDPTPVVRAELIHAQAQVERVPDSAYTSLAKGTAYYAVDNATGIDWAGASLVPSQHSLRAQVSVQDDGGYLLFEHKPGQAWTVTDVGLQGAADALPCPVQVPADVLAVWHWAARSCNPYLTAPASAPTASASSASGASDLTLTTTVRAQLVYAKAAENHLPDSAYTGLGKGTAYYAVDNATGIFWAGASVVPSRHSIRAQVSSQDEGGYNIFEMKPGGSWQIFDAGLDGPDPRTGAACPVKIPSDVLVIWHWQPNSCDPTFN